MCVVMYTGRVCGREERLAVGAMLPRARVSPIPGVLAARCRVLQAVDGRAHASARGLVE
jgi:hypothetical protein